MAMPLFNRNLFFLTLLSLLWAWQTVLVSGFVLSHYPASSALVPQVLPEWQGLLKPKWDPLIYHLALAAAVLFQSALIWANRRGLDTRDLLREWRVYLGLEILLTVLWTSAAFKMIVYADYAVLARNAFIVLLMAAAACKLCCGYWQRWWDQWVEICGRLEDNPGWLKIREWCVPIALFILLFIPDIEGIVARMFIGEQFHHNDSFIMGPGWAYLSGQTPDVDTISQYGIGFVAVISRLANFFGGFSYESVMSIIVSGTILYYLAWYVLIRRWLNSIVLAAALMVIGIKWQMFHTGAFPFVFTYGSLTPMRYVYDVFYFWCIWMHLRTGHKRWLFRAAMACGFGIYYITSEGMYGTASFMAYVFLLWALPFWRAHFRVRLCDGYLLFLPFAVALSLLALTIGPHIFTAPFWNNIGEFINYFLSGFYAEPMYKTLLGRHYLESLLGFVVPSVYLLTLLIFLGRAAMTLGRPEEWFLVVLCFYGLGTYHYYVERAVSTTYYAVCLPLVFILGFWAKTGISYLKENQRAPARWILLAVSSWALLTTHTFIAYPNLINVSSHPLTDPKVIGRYQGTRPYFNHLFRDFDPRLKLSVNSLGGTTEELLAESDFADDAALVGYYRKNSHFIRDARLIASLTGPSDEAPLISSFEVEMLMQARRKPFFYYFPLLISRPMTMRCFSACSIYTTDQLAKTINKFEDTKPPYVFMERIYMVSDVPRDYLFRFPSLIPLVNYVRTYYTPVAQGEYLVALKRK
jgi:hypothetical protein